jgi:chromosome segregation ATPase
MAGPMDDDEHMPPQSARMKGIVQALLREVKKHTEGIDADVQVTNERIGVLEATQVATNIKLETMEASVARIDNSLAALLRRFNDLMTREHDQHQGHNNNNNNNYDEHVDDNWDEYSSDSELDDHDTRRPVQHNHHGWDGH